MQIIVAATNLSALYKASDCVLKKYNSGSSVPENIMGQSTLSVLKKTFAGEYFDICKIDSLCKLHKVEMSTEHYDWMRLLHCVHFTDMHQDTREYLFALCVDYFKSVTSMSYVENS